MQATRGRTTDIEQQNLTVPAKKRSGFLADVAEVGGHSTTSLFLQHACSSQLLLCNNQQHRFGLSAIVAKLPCLLQLVSKHGWTGLYRGLEPALLGTAVSQGVYFYLYSSFRQMAVNRLQTQQKTKSVDIGVGGSLLVAALAGCGNVLLTTPIWTVATRMQVCCLCACSVRHNQDYTCCHNHCTKFCLALAHGNCLITPKISSSSCHQLVCSLYY